MTQTEKPTMPIEFLPWDDIPTNRRRIVDDERQVLGVTFLGEPTWLPHMAIEGES